jgi:hypothetical protein
MLATDAAPAPDETSDLLRHWLSALPAPAQVWLDERVRQIRGGNLRLFYATYSAIPRHSGHGDPPLKPADLAAASALRVGWQPVDWSLDQLARAYVLLVLPAADPAAYARTLATLAASAELRELIALYKSLPLLPHPAAHRALAVEGVRSNMQAVFEAIALDNPYPGEQFEPLAWNQLVLKALFLGSPLNRIQGLDRRANAPLARMLGDFAHERWAAGRRFSPELWRAVGPFATDALLEDLQRALADPDPLQQEAAALALSQSPAEAAAQLLAQRPELQTRIRSGELNWTELAERLNPS